MNAAQIFICLRLIAVVLVTSSQLNAADPLRLKLSTVTSNVRSHAPLSLDVHLDWSSTELLEGRLELSCYDGEKLLHRNVGSDVALLAGDRYSRTVLPPMSLAADLQTLTVKAQFLSEKTIYDLGSFELRVPVFWRRSSVIGIVVPHKDARVEQSGELGQALRLDQLGGNQIPARELISTASLVTPDDLRSNGLGLFSFDVLALTNPGFKALETSQLDAIGDWVEAGGSVLVSVDSTNSSEQTQFLNRVAGRTNNVPDELQGGDTLPPGGISDSQGTIRMYKPGLGRSVIVQADSQTDLGAKLAAAAAHLWKIRSRMQHEFLRIGRSGLLTKQLAGRERNQNGLWMSAESQDFDFPYSPFQQVQLEETESLTTILLPKEVRSIPFGVVVIILTLFLAAIVPVDYYVLGHFKRRKFTWILLPVVSLLFTGFTVWLGSIYLGSADYRTSLDFVDLTTGNRVIRSSRFEQLFTATQREVVTELKQSLTANVTVQPRKNVNEQNSGRGRMRADITEENTNLVAGANGAESSVYQGNIPTLFAVKQQMRKWSPTVSRQTSLETTRSIPNFKFEKVGTAWKQSPALTQTAEWQSSLREDIQAILPESTVLLFTQRQILNLNLNAKAPLQNSGEQSEQMSIKHQRLVELVCKVCVRPSTGLFSMVSQISPNGAGDFEDLSILDPDDADQLLLVVVAKQGNDYVVFRRLFHKDF